MTRGVAERLLLRLLEKVEAKESSDATDDENDFDRYRLMGMLEVGPLLLVFWWSCPSVDGVERMGTADESAWDEPWLEDDISFGWSGGRFQVSGIRRFGGVDGVVDGVGKTFGTDEERMEVGAFMFIILHELNPRESWLEVSLLLMLLRRREKAELLFEISVELDFEVACWL